MIYKSNTRPIDEAEREATSADTADEISCPEAGSKFLCTRPLGHAGDHVASDGEFVLERWKKG